MHRGGSGDLFDLVRSEVGPRLQPFAQHLWEVQWDRRGGPPRLSQTIPFPAVNLTVEAGTRARCATAIPSRPRSCTGW